MHTCIHQDMLTNENRRKDTGQSHTGQSCLPEWAAIQHYTGATRQVYGNDRKRRCQILEAYISTQVVQHTLHTLIGKERDTWEAPPHNVTLNAEKFFLTFSQRFAQQVHTRRNDPNTTGRNIIEWHIVVQQPLQDTEMSKATCATASEGNTYSLMGDV